MSRWKNYIVPKLVLFQEFADGKYKSWEATREAKGGSLWQFKQGQDSQNYELVNIMRKQ